MIAFSRMNIFSLAPLYRFIHLFKTFLFFIFGICFRRKNSTNVDGRGDDDRPIEIVSVSQTGEKVSHWSSEVKRNEVNVRANIWQAHFVLNHTKIPLEIDLVDLIISELLRL